MRPESSQRGFALVAAMFLIIVVALLVAAMSRLSSDQHGGNSLAIQQARAYQAARAGLEWGISHVLNAGSCSSSEVSMAGGGLSEFSVSVTCNSTDYSIEGGSLLRLCQLSASAENGSPGARPDYAFRRLGAVVEC